MPFEEDVESVYLDPQERLFQNEFPESAVYSTPPIYREGLTALTVEETHVEVLLPEKLREETEAPEAENVSQELVSATLLEAVCQCTTQKSVLSAKETAIDSAQKSVPSGKETAIDSAQTSVPSERQAPADSEVCDDIDSESLYERLSAEDFEFGDSGSCAFELQEIYTFTDSELDLPFEEEIESVYLGSKERLFQDEFPGTAVLTTAVPQPIVMAQTVLPQTDVLVPSDAAMAQTLLPQTDALVTSDTYEAPAMVMRPEGVRLEAEEGYRIERVSSSTGDLRDEIYYDVSGKTVIGPDVGQEQILVSHMPIIGSDDFLKLKDDVFSDILSEVIAKCAEKQGLSDVSQILAEVIAASDIAVGRLDVPDIASILDDLLLKCGATTAEKLETSDITKILSEVISKYEDAVADKPEASDIARILSELITRSQAASSDKSVPPKKLETSLADSLLPDTEVVSTKRVCTCAARRQQYKPKVEADEYKPKVEADESSETFSYTEESYSRTTAEDFPFGVTGSCIMEPATEYYHFTDSELDLPFEEEPEEVELGPEERLFKNEFPDLLTTVSVPLQQATGLQVPIKVAEISGPVPVGEQAEVSEDQKGILAPAGLESTMPVPAVSESSDSLVFEDSYSRVTAEEFPFGETGSCVLEPPKEYGFTDSELELPFEEEEPLVELGPDERLFQNEFGGVVSASYKPVPESPEGVITVPAAGGMPEKPVEVFEVPPAEPVLGVSKVLLEDQEEETFFEAVGEEVVMEGDFLEEESLEYEVEGDLDTQLQSLRQRLANKSQDIMEIKQLLSEMRQQQSRMEGKLGMEPLKLPDESKLEEEYITSVMPGAVTPVTGAQATPSEMQAAVACLQDKCRLKDHMIGAMVEELRARAQSGIWNDLKTRIAAPEMPQPDYTRSQVVEYLSPEEQFPHVMPETAGPCSCSGDAKPAVCLPPPVQEQRACLSPQPVQLHMPPPSTCTCPGDFKIIRKIGFDSLLLGWQVPSMAANLSGYDIYVNGALQCKVWSGTRNRALLHCLDLNSPMVILLYGRTTSGQLSGPARITYPGGL